MFSVPKTVPKHGRNPVQTQPTPTKVPIKNGPEIVNFQARSVIPGSLIKPPPSASRPPHRASASIRDKDTYAETLDREGVKATRVQTVAFDAKCNHTSALWRSRATRFGHSQSGHTPGHTRRVFRSVCSENGRKTRQGDGFFDRRLSSMTTPHAALLNAVVWRDRRTLARQHDASPVFAAWQHDGVSRYAESRYEGDGREALRSTANTPKGESGSHLPEVPCRSCLDRRS